VIVEVTFLFLRTGRTHHAGNGIFHCIRKRAISAFNYNSTLREASGLSREGRFFFVFQLSFSFRMLPKTETT